ncbi:MAG: transketolase [Candidatus Omnitrophica bacterium]|nr:transketolase [Candidatus Omnitrophota bacterium]
MERFVYERLPGNEIEKLKNLRKECIRDILTMTTIAGSGHPGGSMSILDILLTVFSYAGISPGIIDNPERDKILISCGHLSPGTYSVLGRLGYFDIESVIPNFRKYGSPFEGHVERNLTGIEWSSGNLGQGLSAGCGFALADRLNNHASYTFVLMSDGEQTKGQIGEARRFAIKYKLNKIKVIIDYNKLQISGNIFDVMPDNIKENYLADGWEVIETDGHNIDSLYTSIKKSLSIEKPVCILANTIMGKGVSFMENKYGFHGKALKPEELQKALDELGMENKMDYYRELSKTEKFIFPEKKFPVPPVLKTGKPHLYDAGTKIDNRTGYGNALMDIGKENKSDSGNNLIVFDCDLASSVKTDLFAKEFPGQFFQVGVQEHNAATIAGASSVNGMVSFFSDFGVFGVDEVYNQQRLNDINRTNLKLVCTHVGLDVGEDGKTHQCVDYLGLFRNLFGFKVIIPADANQTDRAIRYIVAHPGNFFVGMGRSISPVILTKEGKPYFDENYEFQYGKWEILREGKDGYIYTTGIMTYRAVQISGEIEKENISIGVINCPAPLLVDEDILKIGIKSGLVISYEDHIVTSGLGATISLYLSGKGISVKFKKFGVSKYGSSGKPEELYKEQGIDEENVKEFIRRK